MMQTVCEIGKRSFAETICTFVKNSYICMCSAGWLWLMADCVAACFEFGASEDAHDDGSSVPRIDDERRDNSGQGSTSTASPNAIDVEQSTNVESAQSNGIPSPEAVSTLEQPSDATNHHHRLSFCVMMAVVSIGGMGVATFGVLAGGKVGFALLSMFEMTTYGAIDAAVSMSTAIQPDPAVPPGLRKRGAAWFAIAILQGSADALRSISFDEKREGTVWQPGPIIFSFIGMVICRIGLTPMVMMRAHCDRQPNAMKWWVLALSMGFLGSFGACSPYPLVLALGIVLNLLVSTFGLYFLVMKLDKDAVQAHVKNGYKFLAGAGMINVVYSNLHITTMSFLGPFAISGALVLFQNVVLQVIIPAFKLCFRDDERKLWSYPVPAAVLGLELAPCLLVLGSDMASLEFWGLLVMQEFNSLLKNTGKYDSLYVAVCAQLNRPVEEDERKLMEEERMTLAPCDNICELISPVVIMIAIGLESAFDWLPFERAPYCANSGVMGGWRNERFHGEAPIMLMIIFFVRFVFCWIEITVRARQRGNDGGAAAGARSRRSSMAVLYHRVVRSGDAPVHMQYMAGALFAMQPSFFVMFAAVLGRL